MTTPTVTELLPALEPVTDDPFIECIDRELGAGVISVSAEPARRRDGGAWHSEGRRDRPVRWHAAGRSG